MLTKRSIDYKLPVLYSFYIVLCAVMAFHFRDGTNEGASDFYWHHIWVNDILVDGFGLYNLNLYHNAIALMVLLTGRSITLASGILLFSMKVFFIATIHYYVNRNLEKRSRWVWFVVAVTALAGSIPNIFDSGANLMYHYGFGLNVWHNATTYTVMPFVIITFFMFLESINLSTSSFDESNGKKRFYLSCLLLAVFLVLSVLGKPSWFPPFAVAALIFLFFYWASDKFSFSRFKDCIVLGLSFIPAGLLAIFISNNTLHSTDLIFGITSYIRPIPVILNLFFPLLVLFLRFKTIKTNRLLQMGWLTYIISLLNGVFIIEAGIESHGNMTWAILYSMVVLLMVSLIEFTRYIKENEKNPKARPIIYAGLTIAYVHMISGVFYAYHIIGGGNFLF